MEAFSDGVIAIIITIMVLQLALPRGDTLPGAEANGPCVSYLPSQLCVYRDLLE